MVFEGRTERGGGKVEEGSGRRGEGEQVASVYSGTRWNTIGSGGLQLIRLLTSISLARLLGPEDFGVMAVALVTVQLIDMFQDFGTGRAIIQRPELTPALYSSVFSFNLVLGGLSALLLVLCADVVAALFGQGQPLPQMLRVLAISSVVVAASSAQRALLMRRLAFGKLAVATLSGSLLNAGLSVTLALAGKGVWAMVIGYLSDTVVQTLVIVMLCSWRPRLQLRRAELMTIWEFSSNLVMANLVQFVLRNADSLIVARFLGTGAMGYLSMARRLVAPARMLGRILGGVINPALARRQGDLPRFRQDLLRAASGLALLTFPVLAGTAVVARPFIEGVLGADWTPAVRPAEILAPTTIGLELISFAGAVFYAVGRTRALFLWMLSQAGCLVVAWLIGAQFGLSGVVGATAVVTVALFYPGIAIPCGLVGLSFGQFCRALEPYVTLTAGMVVIALGVRYVTEGSGWGPQATVGASAFAGSLAYGGLAWFRRPAALEEFGRLLGIKAAGSR